MGGIEFEEFVVIMEFFNTGDVLLKGSKVFTFIVLFESILMLFEIMLEYPMIFIVGVESVRAGQPYTALKNWL